MILATIHGWWFIALPIALIGLLRYRWYAECLIAGIAYDSLFGLVASEGVSSYAGTILAVTLFTVMSLLKKIMRK